VAHFLSTLGCLSENRGRDRRKNSAKIGEDNESTTPSLQKQTEEIQPSLDGKSVLQEGSTIRVYW
jgi:hypothetical protein